MPKYLVVASMLLLVKSPGFPANYYLVLASDEPVLIRCNFTVFLWTRFGFMLAKERRGRIVNDAFAVLSKIVHLSAFRCLPVFGFHTSTNQKFEGMFKFWREQNLIDFNGNWKTRREKLGTQRILAIWLADPAVLTRSGSVSRSKDWLMAALNIFQHNTSSIPALPIIPATFQVLMCWMTFWKQKGEKWYASPWYWKNKEYYLGVVWFVAHGMSLCHDMEHLTWWVLEDPYSPSIRESVGTCKFLV